MAAILTLGAIVAGPAQATPLDDQLRADAATQPGPFGQVAAAALAGDPGAERAVGAAYEWGQGLRMHPRAALDWYRRAARHGEPKAMVDLAIMVESGQAGPIDMPAVIGLFRQAAASGEANGSVRLGMAYEWGRGLDRDPCQAAALYTQAARQGSAMAPLYLDLMVHHAETARCDTPVS